MKRRTGVMATVSAALIAGLAGPPRAEAAMAVIDVAAIRQLVAQVNYWRQQIDAMQRELDQLRETHAALTGPRGMETLLPFADAERNYLPRDWAGVAQVLAGQSGQYRALADAVEAGVEARAVLTPARLTAMTEAERTSVLEARRAATGLAVMTREAYAQAGARFAVLAQLVNAIGSAEDAKAIADLQGRIAAEQAMLENEQAKLALLAQAAESERWVREQELRELALAGHGVFAERLRPRPPGG
jgi:type IV secretion system protein VirB5